jgi:predicted nucleotide-binding protein
MATEIVTLIGELRSGLDSVFEQFRREGSSVNVQAQLDRWRTSARKKIHQQLGEEESDTFNGLSLTVGFGAGLYESQEDMTLDYIQRAAAYLEALENAARLDGTFESRAATSNADPKRVFVVHGRNTSLNRALFSFLRALKLTPFEWEEAVALIGGSPYVGDVVVEGMKHAQATVVLFTPDESVCIRPELANGDQDPDLIKQYQPRPNVLFEAGISLAIDERRTILVEVGKQRSFSDIFGRHLVRLDNSASRRNALAGRLKTAGCAVDTSGDHWLSEGDFDALPSSDLSTPLS